MKVLLLKHVNKLGKEGDIIEVADGFAVNSLFPQKKAVQATAKIINDHKTKLKADELKEKKEKEQHIAYVASLDGKIVTIEEKANDKGSLYHAVSSKEIIRAIYDQLKVNIPNTLFSKIYSFKETGEYELILEAHGTKGTITLLITEKK